MKINLALWDRSLRFFLGFLMTAWAIAGGPLWAYFGLYLQLSSAWGFCVFYPLFKIKTIHFDGPPDQSL